MFGEVDQQRQKLFRLRLREMHSSQALAPVVRPAVLPEPNARVSSKRAFLDRTGISVIVDEIRTQEPSVGRLELHRRPFHAPRACIHSRIWNAQSWAAMTASSIAPAFGEPL